MARPKAHRRGHIKPRANAAMPHPTPPHPRSAFSLPVGNTSENTISSMPIDMTAANRLPLIVSQQRNLLLRRTTGLKRLDSIWELMPAPGPGAGGSVVVMMRPPRSLLAFWQRETRSADWNAPWVLKMCHGSRRKQGSMRRDFLVPGSGLSDKSGLDVHEQLVSLRARQLRTRRNSVGGEQFISNLSVRQRFLIAVLSDQRLGPKKV